MNQIRLRVEEVGVGSIEKMRHRIAIIAENCRRDIMKELRQLHGPCENYKPHNFNVLMSQGHYPASCTIIPDGELASEFTYIFEGRVTKRSRQYSMHRIVDATAQAMRKDQRKQAMMKRSMSKALNEKKKGSSASDGN
jgi:ketol-acid reductoisomerase